MKEIVILEFIFCRGFNWIPHDILWEESRAVPKKLGGTRGYLVFRAAKPKETEDFPHYANAFYFPFDFSK